MFDTTTWSDPWFKKLGESAKLLFIYLWTNERCNAAGMYRIDKQIMMIEAGLNGHDPDELLENLAKSVLYNEQEEVVWVKNFFRKQCQNASFGKSAIKSLKSLPEPFGAKFCNYNSKTLKSFGIKSPCWQGENTVLTAQHSTVTAQNSITSSKEEEPERLPDREEILLSSEPKLKRDLEDICMLLKSNSIFPKAFLFKNKALKEKKNKRAILHTLRQCYLNKPKDDPWPYCRAILKVEDGNYNERENSGVAPKSR